MTTAPRIETPRLTLRAHEMADFPPLYDLFASDRARFMGGPVPAKDMWYWIAAEVGSWPLKGFGSWGIIRNADHAFIGQVGINEPHHFPEPELGWVLLDPFEGHGYASEAAQAALNWWWDQNRADSIVSYIDPQNDRSIALAKRLGARQDAHAPLPTGETPDETVVYRHRRPS